MQLDNFFFIIFTGKNYLSAVRTQSDLSPVRLRYHSERGFTELGNNYKSEPIGLVRKNISKLQNYLEVLQSFIVSLQRLSYV